MSTYTISTDAVMQTVTADSLDEAIAKFTATESGLSAQSAEELVGEINAIDGAWGHVSQDGLPVLEIGEIPTAYYLEEYRMAREPGVRDDVYALMTDGEEQYMQWCTVSNHATLEEAFAAAQAHYDCARRDEEGFRDRGEMRVARYSERRGWRSDRDVGGHICVPVGEDRIAQTWPLATDTWQERVLSPDDVAARADKSRQRDAQRDAHCAAEHAGRVSRDVHRPRRAGFAHLVPRPQIGVGSGQYSGK